MNRNKRTFVCFKKIIITAGIAMAALLLTARADAQPGARQAAPEAAPDAPREWTAELKRNLERQCQEGDGCFKLPVGDKVGGLVPLADVSDAEKSQFWADWKVILQPEYFPTNPSKVEWRKLLLTKVRWAPRKPGEKGWGAPTADWICARWEEGGHAFVAIDRTITLNLTGAARLAYRHPTRQEVSPEAKEYFLDTQIDMAALLNILITFFRVPWQAETDFVVRWSLAAPSPNSLRIRSALFQKEMDPPHWRDWYDDFSFELSGDDPQYMTFGFWVPPGK